MGTRSGVVGRIAGLALVGLLFPALTSGQGATNGAISGVVKDTSGAVMPGVTVEAASPALIEKVRAGVTNDQGQYQIQDLRPGQYTVTFTLPGFNTFRREGVVLTAGFSATVNADMNVGSVEESVTVTGQAPLVDVRNTATRQSFTNTVINDLPTAKNFANLAVLIPGVTVSGVVGTPNTQDVGGTTGERLPRLSIHGSRGEDMPVNFDGIRMSNGYGAGAGTTGAWVANAGMVEEVLVETSGMSAEAQNGGLQINNIPKQGGNTFSGSFYSAYTNSSLQANNLTPELIARGATRAVTKKIWDVNPSFGGPLKRDKVWFYYSFRSWGTTNQPPGSYYDANVTDWVYTQDRNRAADVDTWQRFHNLRVTWQISPKHKLAGYVDDGANCNCRWQISATTAPEATNSRSTPLNNNYSLTWNWTASNRVLIEAVHFYRREHDIYNYPLAAPDMIEARELGTGVTFRAMTAGLAAINSHPVRGRASASYVTGSHNLKVGAQWVSTDMNQKQMDGTAYTLSNAAPTSVILTGIRDGWEYVRELGFYAQDSWAYQRLTLNLGGRIDFLKGYIPEQHLPSSKWMGARDFPRIENLPNWRDVSPRIGASYDVFGNGRTAVKFGWGRFVEAMAVQIAQDVNPALTAANAQTTRAWSDRNGDFVPQEDELGASTNRNFGTSFVATRYDDGVTTGFGKRQRDWEMSTGIQHEVRTGLSVNAGYFHRGFQNFRLTDNVLVTPADYNPYCVTAPVDPRLPGGGGNQICGLYDITPAKLGINDNVIRFASDFGNQTQVFDGVDFNVSARLPGRVTFMGGTSTGRVKTNRCFVVDSPQELLNCEVNPPVMTQFKMSGVYPLPWWGVQTSAVYQNIAPPQITADWAAPAAAVTGLGRPLAGGARTVNVPLVAPGTMYGERLQQLDLRVSKRVRLRGVNVEAQFDLYNVLNGNAIVAMNNTFGAAWQRPTAILLPRLAKFGVRVDF